MLQIHISSTTARRTNELRRRMILYLPCADESIINLLLICTLLSDFVLHNHNTLVVLGSLLNLMLQK